MVEVRPPYRIPLEDMQARRQHNLSLHVANPELSDANRSILASVALDGAYDALHQGDFEAAHAFVQHWARYHPLETPPDTAQV